MIPTSTTRKDLAPIAVLGAGKMGMQIGLEYALGGHNVACIVRHHDAAIERLERSSSLLIDLQLATTTALDAARQHMTLVTLDHTLPFDPHLIVESLPEDLEIKAKLLGTMTNDFPQAKVATNTSSLSITALGAAIGAGDRIIGTHYLNPVLLMPLVEVIPGSDTSPTVITETMKLLEGLGKEPILVRGEPIGFVWNRLQFAILREALSLVEEGVVQAKGIDVIIRRGLARRWRALGVFGVVALGGVETFIAAARNIVPRLSDQDDLSALGDIVPIDRARLTEARNILLAKDLQEDRRD